MTVLTVEASEFSVPDSHYHFECEVFAYLGIGVSDFDQPSPDNGLAYPTAKRGYNTYGIVVCDVEGNRMLIQV